MTLGSVTSFSGRNKSSKPVFGKQFKGKRIVEVLMLNNNASSFLSELDISKLKNSAYNWKISDLNEYKD